jgi:hypothetical protein
LTGHLLQPVVADSGRRTEAFLHVARLQGDLPAALINVIGPDTGIAIGLQLHLDGQGIPIARTDLTLKLPYLLLRSV